MDIGPCENNGAKVAPRLLDQQDVRLDGLALAAAGPCIRRRLPARELRGFRRLGNARCRQCRRPRDRLDDRRARDALARHLRVVGKSDMQVAGGAVASVPACLPACIFACLPACLLAGVLARPSLIVAVAVIVVVIVAARMAISVGVRRALHMDMVPAARLEHHAERSPRRKARCDLREQDERQQDLGQKTTVHALGDERTVQPRRATVGGSARGGSKSVSLGPFCGCSQRERNRRNATYRIPSGHVHLQH